MTTFSDFEKIAAYTGELVAAAQHDLATADPSDVGMSGIPVVAWRKAYLEGCRDMANGVFTRVPEDIREQFEQTARAAHATETAAAQALSSDHTTEPK